MSDPLTVRQATGEDLRIIVGYNRSLALDTERLELDERTLIEGVRWALAHPDTCPYFVAERAGKIIGQCMITFEWTDWQNGWLWWFQSVYVDPQARGGGVFRALFRHVEELARSSPDARGLRLYVEQSNRGAQDTYVALGMRPSGHYVYALDLM